MDIEKYSWEYSYIYTYGIVFIVFFSGSIKKTILVGASISICFEIVQYIIAIGISDIDDLILNTFGVIIGCGIYKAMSNSYGNFLKLSKTLLIIILIMGVCGFCVVLVMQPDLLLVTQSKMTVQNEALVKDFDRGKIFDVGSLISASLDKITIQTKDEPREQLTYNLAEGTEIISQTVKQKYFINSLREELITFSKIDSLELNDLQEKHDWASVSVWSKDGIMADKIMVAVVVES